jgi:Na+/melibiose symporter-like transporter
MEIAVPFFVKKQLHESSFFLGALLSVEGVGAVFAAFSICVFEKYLKKERLLAAGIILSSIGVFMLGVCHEKELMFFFMAINGAGIAAACIIFNTSLLSIVPEAYRSRFFTIVLFSEGLAAPIGLFSVGHLIDFVGITKSFMFMGAGLFCLMLVEHYSKTFRFLSEGFQ